MPYLNKLPTYTSPTQTQESVAKSFCTFFEEVRPSDLSVVRKARKFQLPITAGKSVLAEKVEKFQEYREKGNKKEDSGNSVSETKKRGSPMASKNKKKKKTTDTNKDTEDIQKEEVDNSKKDDTNSENNEMELQEIEKDVIVVEALVHQPPKSATTTEREFHHKIIENQVEDIIEEIEDLVINEEGANLQVESEVILEQELLIEEYFVDESNGALTAMTPDHKETRKYSLRVFTDEGSLFSGRIVKVGPLKVSISVLQ